ncbi:MAG: CoA transferase [Nitrososphaerota archaeon]|nr:CoA transferase [Nitrososphaerota archaeon]MDG6935396.1 CoA transferase [Nitrososphaerota archaeon]
MKGPLAGVRVLDFTIQLAGPLSTMMLGQLGAEILKVEPPLRGAPERAGSPSYKGLSAYFMGTGWNKKSITLNLKTEEGKAIARRLASSSDIVVQNFRPGVAERLGIGYDELRKVNERLVYCSIAGFDADHPYSSKPSFDLISQALSGLVSLYTQDEVRPTVPISLADILTGYIAAQSIIAALFNRERTGRGELIKASLFQSSLYLISPIVQGLLQGLENNIDSLTRVKHVGFMGVFYDSNRELFVVEAPDDNFFKSLGKIPELTGLISKKEYSTKVDRADNWERLDREIQEAFSKKPRSYWLSEMNKLDIPCGPVMSVDEALSEVQNQRYIAEVNDDMGTMKTVAYPARFLSTGLEYSRPPRLGENTAEALREIGYSEAEIEALKSNGVI